ncbi:MAG: response regulator [Lachnospiraceae bacterium]|nr:response regulator [Lachnospiraceae bacterium]
MTLEYNIYYEVAAAAFLVIMYIYIKLQYTIRTEVNTEFQKLIVIVIIADILDIVTAITISYGAVVPHSLNVVLNTIYFAVVALLGYQFITYSQIYIYKKKRKTRILRVNLIVLIGYECLLLANTYGGFIFRLDQAGEYIHSTLYILVYLVPYYFFLSSIVIMIGKFRIFEKKQQIALIIYSAIVITGPMLEFIVFSNVLLGMFSISLAVMMVSFSMESSDYRDLMITMKTLEQTKEEADKAKRQALEASQAKSQFLANMSHEIRTPINAVLGMNELILRETNEPSVRDYAKNIDSAGRTLLSVINDILDFSKIESGKMTIVPVVYSLSSVINDLYNMIIPRTNEKGLDFVVNVDEAVPDMLLGDEIRIRQIILNLLTNAVKYTEGGTIELRVFRQYQGSQFLLCVTVKDSGIGIKKEDLTQLFDAFQRFDERRNRTIEGTGLGLNITKHMLDLMDGILQVSSVYGEGSEFTAIIPQEISNPHPIGDYRKRLQERRERALEDKGIFRAPDAKILAVDDNEMNLKVLSGLLERTGVQLDTAVSGRDCIRKMSNNSYHLLLLDHMMPEMDGIETLQRLKKENLVKDIPVIVLTANAVSGAKEEYIKAGFEDYLAKPTSGVELEKILAKWLPPHLSRMERKGKTTPSKVLADWLDLEQALRYSVDDMEGVWQNIRYFCEDAEELDVQISKDYEKEKCYDYSIHVQALCGNAVTIGANELAEYAVHLREAAKEDDMEQIIAGHKYMMAQYRTLVRNLRRLLEERGEYV